MIFKACLEISRNMRLKTVSHAVSTREPYITPRVIWRHKVTTRGKNNINIWLPVIISILIGKLRNIFKSKQPRSSIHTPGKRNGLNIMLSKQKGICNFWLRPSVEIAEIHFFSFNFNCFSQRKAGKVYIFISEGNSILWFLKHVSKYLEIWD
jgi:hypothetical protein